MARPSFGGTLPKRLLLGLKKKQKKACRKNWDHPSRGKEQRGVATLRNKHPRSVAEKKKRNTKPTRQHELQEENTTKNRAQTETSVDAIGGGGGTCGRKTRWNPSFRKGEKPVQNRETGEKKEGAKANTPLAGAKTRRRGKKGRGSKGGGATGGKGRRVIWKRSKGGKQRRGESTHGTEPVE